MQRTKLTINAFALILMIAVAFCISFTTAASTNTTIINSAGNISKSTSSTVIAISGSPYDVQAAVNTVAAAGGGTVIIPAGTFRWNNQTVIIPGGVNVMGTGLAGCSDHSSNWASYNASTILHNDFQQGSPSMPDMFYLNGQNNKPIRISGIQFEATPPPNPTQENMQVGGAINAYQCKNFRIDHCTFINFCNMAVFCDASSGHNPNASSYGVLDHCVVDNSYKLNGSGWLWGYGFYARGTMKPDFTPPNWDSDIKHFLGKYEPIPSCSLMYVEDCHFSRCRHDTDGIQGAWDVVRYCLSDTNIPNWGNIDSHGTYGWYSARGFEVYNNTVIGNEKWSDNIAIRLRDGSGMIYNNTFINSKNGTNVCVLLDNDDASNTYPYTHVNNTYIWGNTLVNASLLQNTANYTVNVDYFLRPPSMSIDGFAYSPYSYPHPLTK